MNSHDTPPHESRAATTLQPIASIEGQRNTAPPVANRGLFDLFDIGPV